MTDTQFPRVDTGWDRIKQPTYTRNIPPPPRNGPLMYRLYSYINTSVIGRFSETNLRQKGFRHPNSRVNALITFIAMDWLYPKRQSKPQQLLWRRCSYLNIKMIIQLQYVLQMIKMYRKDHVLTSQHPNLLFLFGQ